MGWKEISAIALILFGVFSLGTFSIGFLGTSEISSLVLYSLTIGLALSALVTFSIFKVKDKSDYGKIWKIPVMISVGVALIISIFTGFAYLGCSGEECMVIILFFGAWVGVAIVAAISLLIYAFFYFTDGNSIKILKILLIILTLLILVSGILLFYSKGCAIKDYACLSNKAIEKNDLSICEKFSWPPTCYKRVAIQMGDASICEMIVCPEGGISCEGIGSRKENCYSYIGIQSQNKELCNKITSAQLKEECLSQTDGCESINDEFLRERCYNPGLIIKG